MAVGSGSRKEEGSNQEDDTTGGAVGDYWLARDLASRGGRLAGLEAVRQVRFEIERAMFGQSV